MCVLGTCIWCVDTSGQMPVYGRTAGFITVMYECVTEVMPSASEREGKGHSRDLHYRGRPSCFTEWLTHSVLAQAVCSHSSRLPAAKHRPSRVMYATTVGCQIACTVLRPLGWTTANVSQFNNSLRSQVKEDIGKPSVGCSRKLTATNPDKLSGQADSQMQVCLHNHPDAAHTVAWQAIAASCFIIHTCIRFQLLHITRATWF